jgi:hypothetical protein
MTAILTNGSAVVDTKPIENFVQLAELNEEAHKHGNLHWEVPPPDLNFAHVMQKTHASP